MSPAKLTAAGARYTQRKNRSVKSVDQGWQRRAWAHFATPEVRFVATWVGNAMSRARLFAGTRGTDGQVIPLPPSHRASELVAAMAGGITGQAQMLKKFGPHLVVPGEGWIVIRPKLDREERRTGEEWCVLSTSEVQQQGNRLTADINGVAIDIPGDDPDGESDPNVPIAIRVWNPHPEKYMEADSCVRASLEVLDELRLLSAAVAAIARSRLTGRGIVLIPKGTRFPAAPGQSSAEDDLIDVLIEVAETAYREPESAAATVPIFLEVPAETIAAIKRLTFESSFDDLAIKLREEQIRRWANGSDTPPEVLLGMGAANHWSAWSISEDAITYAIEPKLDTFTDAVTTQWLQPALEAERVEGWDEILVHYDTSPLRVRANRSQTALEVYDRGELSGPALRRETGFEESDAPAEAVTPPPPATDDEAGEEQAPADLPVDETNNPPQLQPVAASATPDPAAVADGLLAAADGLIWAALSHAGERLRRTPCAPARSAPRPPTSRPPSCTPASPPAASRSTNYASSTAHGHASRRSPSDTASRPNAWRSSCTTTVAS